MHPLLILLPSAALLGVAVAISAATFKSTCRRASFPLRCRKAVVGRFRLIAAPEDQTFEHEPSRVPGERLDDLPQSCACQRHAIAAPLAALLLAAAGASARRRLPMPPTTPQARMLAAVTRQLELLDRLAEHAAATTARRGAPFTTSTTSGCAPT